MTPFRLSLAATCAFALGACSTTTTESIDSTADVLLADVSTDAATVGEVGGAPDAAAGGDLDATFCENLTPTESELWVPEAGDFVFRDTQSGSWWNLRGQAYAGPCEGAQLAQLPSFVVFWFAWSTANDGGEIWNSDEINSPGPIQADPSGDCNVPCSEIRSGGPPPDGIPALDHEGRWSRPQAQQMVAADTPEAEYLDDFDMVNGVHIDGEARAYPHNLLNWHENHVDAIGESEFNVTYCPLTGSAIVFPADQGAGDPMYFYVSGRLYNDNLTMFERGVDQVSATFWNQVLRRGISGPRAGEQLEILPVVETTWVRWRQMHPDTLVASGITGYSRDYGRNPYSSRQLPDASPLVGASPQWEDFYPNKSRVLALDGLDGTARAYPFEELAAFGDRVVVNDSLDGEPVVVVYEAEHRMALPFSRSFNGQALTFEGAQAQ